MVVVGCQLPKQEIFTVTLKILLNVKRIYSGSTAYCDPSLNTMKMLENFFLNETSSRFTMNKTMSESVFLHYQHVILYFLCVLVCRNVL